MSNVRALLKEKRREARVAHHLASYSSNGQLRCIACGTVIKQASSWDGHIGSKGHRVNVIHMKEQQKQKGEQQAGGAPKRRAESTPADDHTTEVVKKRRIGDPPASANGLPANFFSDPSRVPAFPVADDSDDEQAEAKTPPPPPVVSNNPLDLEWEQFQRAVLNTARDTGSNLREAYERATVVVEPELNDTMVGLPAQQEAAGDAEGGVSSQHLTEEQLRKLKQQEEKELIMDRLLEEERAQEEADAKVTLLKSRLEALKKKRQAAKIAKVTRA